MLFVAEQLREVMASLGFRTVDEMVGHPECLRQIEVPGNRKANLLDLSPVLASATCEFGAHIPGADGRHFLPQMAADGFHRQKMTSATASQPTPDRPSWFHTPPAMVMM